MKKIGIELILVLIGWCAFAQAFDPDAKVVLDAMSNKYRETPSFSAIFKQKLTNETAGFEETIDGKIYVKKNKYKLELIGQTIFNDGVNVWAYNPEAKEVTVSIYDPEEQEVSLNNIWELYKEGFKYILLASNDNGKQVIDLDPIDRTKSYYKIRMFIKQDYSLHSFIVFETSGNKYHCLISDFKIEKNLKNEDFVFQSANYPNVEVIDFRE